jgi:hypothetical protein
VTEDEIKDQMRQQLKKRDRIKFRLPSPGRPGGGTLGMCKEPSHRCAGCGRDKPRFEFNAPESRICLHERCYQLWTEVEKEPRPR